MLRFLGILSPRALRPASITQLVAASRASKRWVYVEHREIAGSLLPPSGAGLRQLAEHLADQAAQAATQASAQIVPPRGFQACRFVKMP